MKVYCNQCADIRKGWWYRGRLYCGCGDGGAIPAMLWRAGQFLQGKSTKPWGTP